MLTLRGRALTARRVRHARAVVLAIGYYDLPNYLGIPGEDLPHVSHYYDDAHPYYRQARGHRRRKEFSGRSPRWNCFGAGAHVTLVHRRAALGDSIKYWVRPDIENRIKEGSVKAHFNTCVVEITPASVIVDQGRQEIPADHVFLLTGYHPDATLMRAAGITVNDETLAPDLNPGNVRNERAEPLHRRGRDRRAAHGIHLHRERTLPRRADHPCAV
jgi:thioredoxin reductase (NADPH)